MQVNIFNSGDDLILPGAENMPPVRTLLYPATSGLQSALYLGYGATQATKNNYGSAVGKVVGAPVFDNGFATLDASNYIDMSVPESASMSLFVLARRKPSSSGDAILVGNYAASNPGASIYMSGADICAEVGSTPQAAALKALGVANGWRIYAFKFSGTTLTTTLNSATASVITNAGGTIAARRISSNGSIRIGAGYGGTWTGSVDVAAASVHSAGLGSADTNTIIEHFREYAKDFGLVLV